MYRRLEYACASLLLAAIVALVGIAAVSRAMGSPIIWSIEIAQLLFVWLCMLAADLALQENRHFGLMVLLEKLSPERRRLMEIANLAIMICLVVFLFFYAWKNAVLMHPRLLGATQMNGSLIHTSMVVGLALLTRTMVLQLIARVRG
ncbi:MAG: TRAP transporter small permease subunit [Rhodospirillales bacterium]